MRKQQIIKIIKAHWNKIKLIWIIFSVIVMVVAVRTYINYTTIKDAIYNVEIKIEEANKEIEYTEKFLKKYLDSDFADYFLAHKNNILFDWEYIIRFQSPKESDNQEDKNKTDNENEINSASESRNHFIKSKLQK